MDKVYSKKAVQTAHTFTPMYFSIQKKRWALERSYWIW